LLPVLAFAFFVVAGAVVAVHRGFSARDQPSELETYVARTARSMAVSSRAKSEKNPFTPSPELMAETRAHFADHCAICHANNGSGNTEIGQNLYPKAPDMRLPQTQNLTDGEIYYTIHNGIRLTGMPAWGTEEKDEDSWKLLLFIRHLTQVTQEEEREIE
jgi:mono/diheme cytochrome c family protein